MRSRRNVGKDVTNNICNEVRGDIHMTFISRVCKAKIRYWSEVRQWSHSFMIPWHYLWAKSNNRTGGQLERHVTWFCLFTCTVWLLFHSLLERVCGCVLCVRGGVGEGVRLKLDFQVPGGEKILDVDGQRRGGPWKLDNFHGRHMCKKVKWTSMPNLKFMFHFVLVLKRGKRIILRRPLSL